MKPYELEDDALEQCVELLTRDTRLIPLLWKAIEQGGQANAANPIRAALCTLAGLSLLQIQKHIESQITERN